MSKRNGFVLYQESWPLIEELSFLQRGILLSAIFAYDNGDDLPDMDTPTRVVFLEIKGKMDRSAKSYETICERRREAAKKRWTNAQVAEQDNAKNANADFAKQKCNTETETETETETGIKENPPKGGKRKAKTFADLFADSPDLNQGIVQEAWEDWLEVRKKYPWTDRASVLNANALKKYSRGDPIRAVKILEYAVERGWRGIYDPDDNPKQKGKTLNWDSVVV